MNTYEEYRSDQIEEKMDFLAEAAVMRDTWIEKNRYYYDLLYKKIHETVPHQVSVCHFGCDSATLLNYLAPKYGMGICFTEKQAEVCRSQGGHIPYMSCEEARQDQMCFDYIVITYLGYVYDIQELLAEVLPFCHHRTRVIIVNYNALWEPIFRIGELLGRRMPQPLQRQNMVPTHHILNLLPLTGFELVKWSSLALFPISIPFVSAFLNHVLAPSFPFRFLASTDLIVARSLKEPSGFTICSVIVPCKDERGNIEPIVKRMPEVADATEIIFIDDKSSDGTREEMELCREKYPEKDIKIIDGPGICKGEAVRVGCEGASGDIIAILDADLAVSPEELPKCISPLLDGTADFVNTVRFVYPQEGESMRWLNMMGNRFFAMIFAFLLRQPISDTLCGTKVFWKKDYDNISELRDYWIWRDRWGDFEQLLGASKLGLKIVDIPVHYSKRVYGETKMKNRLRNGFHMLKLCLGGFIRLRLG